MWDEQIDEVARRLTSASPPADLKVRVLDRIGERSWTRRFPRFLVPTLAGVAAIAVMTVLLVKPHNLPNQLAEPAPTPQTAAPTTLGPATAKVVPPVSPETRTPSTIALQVQPGATAALATVDSAGVDLGVDLLVLDSLAFDRLEMQQLAGLDSIALTPIEVAALDVAPIEPATPLVDQ